MSFCKVTTIALKNLNHNEVKFLDGKTTKYWKLSASGIVNAGFIVRNSSSKLVRSIPSQFKPRVIVQCGICGATDGRIRIRLNYRVGELEPGLYNLDRSSDRDLHKMLTGSHPLRKEQKVLALIETIFDLSDVMLKTCCTFPIQEDVIRNLDSISAGIINGPQPISVKDLQISEEKINDENVNLLRKLKSATCTHRKTEAPCFKKNGGLGGYSDVIWVISNIILLEVDIFPIDLKLPKFNGTHQEIERYLATHDGDRITFILSYNTQPKFGHALIASWEIGSSEVYIMDTAAPKEDEITSTLTPEFKTKIERALGVLSITKFYYGTDGLGTGAVHQQGSTCAAT